jgi:hypothetical protein
VKRIARAAGAVVGLLVVLLLVYGTAVEPRLVLEERHETAQVPQLPQEWAGQEIAVFSDLQIGMWWDNAGMVEKVVARVVEIGPAATLVVGDLLYSSEALGTQVDTVTGLLEPLMEAGIPTYAVLGNHDHESGGAAELRRALTDLGVRVLQNEHVELAAPGGAQETLHLVGLGATRPRLTDVDAALDGLPPQAPRIVMLHNPTGFPRLPAGSAPFAVAGHTHCGQIAAPGTPEWSYLALTEEEAVVADGFAPEGYGEPGNELFVTCGIGFSLVPVRINAPPQLLVLTLEAQQ